MTEGKLYVKVSTRVLVYIRNILQHLYLQGKFIFVIFLTACLIHSNMWWSTGRKQKMGVLLKFCNNFVQAVDVIDENIQGWCRYT